MQEHSLHRVELRGVDEWIGAVVEIPEDHCDKKNPPWCRLVHNQTERHLTDHCDDKDVVTRVDLTTGVLTNTRGKQGLVRKE